MINPIFENALEARKRIAALNSKCIYLMMTVPLVNADQRDVRQHYKSGIREILNELCDIENLLGDLEMLNEDKITITGCTTPAEFKIAINPKITELVTDAFRNLLQKNYEVSRVLLESAVLLLHNKTDLKDIE